MEACTLQIDSSNWGTLSDFIIAIATCITTILAAISLWSLRLTRGQNRLLIEQNQHFIEQNRISKLQLSSILTPRFIHEAADVYKMGYHLNNESHEGYHIKLVNKGATASSISIEQVTNGYIIDGINSTEIFTSSELTFYIVTKGIIQYPIGLRPFVFADIVFQNTLGEGFYQRLHIHALGVDLSTINRL